MEKAKSYREHLLTQWQCRPSEVLSIIEFSFTPDAAAGGGQGDSRPRSTYFGPPRVRLLAEPPNASPPAPAPERSARPNPPSRLPGPATHEIKAGAGFSFLSSWLAVLLAALCLPGGAAPRAAAASEVYAHDFERLEPGSIPDDFLVLDGDFAVREADGNKFLELPGTPLATYAVLFGPNEKEGIAVSARIYATNKGRRYPAFGVGLNGVAGYRLMVAPAKRSLELYRGDDVVASVDHRWQPGTWSHLSLEVRKTGDSAWTVRGKVWPHEQPEPEDWSITFQNDTEPFSGNASVWGKPFAGTPIRYDDFKVRKLE